MDAEYYQPEFLNVEIKLNLINHDTIGNLSESVLNFGAYSLCNSIVWEENGVPYLNVANIKDGFIDFEGVKFISDKVNNVLRKSEVKEGQVILTMAGTIGNAAVAHKVPKKINSNQAMAKITLKKGLSPYYLSAFLNCYYGKKQTERIIVSSVQPNIFLGQIKDFKVPLINKDQQNKIGKIYEQSLDELENAKSLYSQAENLLLEELNLKNFSDEEIPLNLPLQKGDIRKTPNLEEEEIGGFESNLLSYIVNLSDAKNANRFDAEYFEPKYKKLISLIRANGGTNLGDLVSVKKGIEPGAESYREEGKQFIRVSSLSKYEINNSEQKCLSDELYNKLKANYQPQKGEILLTKDASPGIVYILKENSEGIISSGILRLKLKDKEIEDEYLALCLNSIIGRMQAERDAGGSVIMHWKPEEIKNVIIPILPKPVQEKISSFVRQSFESRKRAKQLLEEAKIKVESLIEKQK